MDLIFLIKLLILFIAVYFTIKHWKGITVLILIILAILLLLPEFLVM